MGWICRCCSTNNDDADTRCIICDSERGTIECVLTSSDVTSYGMKGNVAIPKEFNVIGAKAFLNNCDITSIILHSEVKRVEDEAFAECFELKKVTCHGTLEEIKPKAFRDCYSLKAADRPTASVVAPDAFEETSAGRTKKAAYDRSKAPAPAPTRTTTTGTTPTRTTPTRTTPTRTTPTRTTPTRTTPTRTTPTRTTPTRPTPRPTPPPTPRPTPRPTPPPPSVSHEVRNTWLIGIGSLILFLGLMVYTSIEQYWDMWSVIIGCAVAVGIGVAYILMYIKDAESLTVLLVNSILTGLNALLYIIIGYDYLPCAFIIGASLLVGTILAILYCIYICCEKAHGIIGASFGMVDIIALFVCFSEMVSDDVLQWIIGLSIAAIIAAVEIIICINDDIDNIALMVINGVLCFGILFMLSVYNYDVLIAVSILATGLLVASVAFCTMNAMGSETGLATGYSITGLVSLTLAAISLCLQFDWSINQWIIGVVVFMAIAGIPLAIAAISSDMEVYTVAALVVNILVTFVALGFLIARHEEVYVVTTAANLAIIGSSIYAAYVSNDNCEEELMIWHIIVGAASSLMLILGLALL